MSTCEKAGMLFFRIVAVLILLVGALGVVFHFGVRLLRLHADFFTAEQLVSSFVWILAGVILFLSARPLGRLAARGMQ